MLLQHVPWLACDSCNVMCRRNMRTLWRSASCGASLPPSSSCAQSRVLLAAVLSSQGACRQFASCIQNSHGHPASALWLPGVSGLLRDCSTCSITHAARSTGNRTASHTFTITQRSTGANSAPQPEAAALQSRVNAMTAERELLTAQLAQV